LRPGGRAGLKGAVYLPNIFGCGQIGQDRSTVKRTLVRLRRAPQRRRRTDHRPRMRTITTVEIANEIVPTGKRVESLVIQDRGGTKKTVALGRRIVREMLQDAARLSREPYLQVN